jgi:hypothetical protein
MIMNKARADQDPELKEQEDSTKNQCELEHENGITYDLTDEVEHETETEIEEKDRNGSPTIDFECHSAIIMKSVISLVFYLISYLVDELILSTEGRGGCRANISICVGYSRDSRANLFTDV